jgi:hypothetical protein
MKSTPILAISLLMGSVYMSTGTASACNIRDFLVNDITSIKQSAQSELAFVLSSSQSEFEKAKAGGVLDVFDLFSLDYNQAQSKAQQIAQSINFDSKSSYTSNYFNQIVDQNAIDAYKQCLNHNTPGMYIWLSDHQGDYYTFTGFWVGNNVDQPTAKYDSPPSVTPPAKLIDYPSEWHKGVEDTFVVQSDGTSDFLLRSAVAGKRGSYVIVKDPPNISWKTQPTVSANLIKAASHGPNPGCSAGQARDCISPSHPGGSFVAGTAAMVESSTSDPGHYGVLFDINRLDRVCVVMTQSTGACENGQSAQGRLSAVEKFPVSATTPQ